MTTDKPPVVFLLAVWGEKYITNFFDFSLRSLLAPGNIPSMSQDYVCTFLFLTVRKNIPFFRKHPVFKQLTSYCRIEFIEISDLIFDGNYSATLTMAFERGMRSRGKKMCGTYFFFLVSDYIMANNSLRNLKRYMQAGYSGITTGNFLVVEEYLYQKLKDIIHSDATGLLSLNAREMLKLAFPCLHPVSIAQTVTQPFIHAVHANRLFWKKDDNIIVGRFYLRHMLCIKPEIDHYLIGSSCDYSFIPEMCPSGNIAHIQDSDDYCVIEMSPFNYELRWISHGQFEIKKLAARLSEWTTYVHRLNAHIPIVFHSEDLRKFPHSTIEESAHFINAVEKHLSKNPQPVRGHFYWVSCLESILYWVLSQADKSRYFFRGTLAGIIGSPTFFPVLSSASDDRFLLKITQPPASLPLNKKQKRKAVLKKKMTGASPDTAFWHLHWLDDYRLRSDIKKRFDYSACLVVAFEPISNTIDWLELKYPKCCTYQFYDLLITRSPSELKKIFHDKQQVLMWINEENFYKVAAALRNCSKYLPPNSRISVYLNFKKKIPRISFKKLTSIWSADLLNSQIVCEKVSIHCSLSRAYLQDMYVNYTQKLFAPRRHLWHRLAGLAGLSMLNVACLFGNLLSLFIQTSKKKNTSAIIHFGCNAQESLQNKENRASISQ